MTRVFSYSTSHCSESIYWHHFFTLVQFNQWQQVLAVKNGLNVTVSDQWEHIHLPIMSSVHSITSPCHSTQLSLGKLVDVYAMGSRPSNSQSPSLMLFPSSVICQISSTRSVSFSLSLWTTSVHICLLQRAIWMCHFSPVLLLVKCKDARDICCSQGREIS